MNRCYNCRWFVIEPNKAFPAAHGTCNRHAPRGPAIMSGSGWSAFPPVGVLSFCGEHTPIRAGSPLGDSRNEDLRALTARFEQEQTQ